MKKRTRIASLVLMLLLLLSSGPFTNGVTPVAAGGYCDWVQFVADVTIPDGLPVDPGVALSKTWRLKNIGTCWWNKSYKLVFTGGSQLGGLAAMNLPKDVAPGQTIDLTVGLTAPTTPGTYIGYWQLQNPTGGIFSMGPTANKPFFVEIEVVNKAAPSYDFAAKASEAAWVTEATGRRPYPGVYGDPDGYALVVDRPVLENGVQSNYPGILMGPPAEFNEHIYGIFPAYQVKAGDRFQTYIGCEYGARDCDVTFVLQYQQPGGGGGRTYWSKIKTYKNSFTKVNLNLTPLAGQTVEFVLLIRPNGTSTGDKAIWANPVIVNTNTPGPAVTTVTPAPVTPIPTVSTVAPTTGCDRATFVSDVTVPDGTVFNPGQSFTKTWRLRNMGTCTWTTGYSLVFSSGDALGAPLSVNLTSPVAPRQTVDLSLNFTAPSTPGTYRGYWLLKNDKGRSFGIGTLSNKPFWLSIGVSGTLPPTTGNGYDFAARACDAQWTSGAGPLPCPSQDASNGTVMVITNPRLENNTVDPRSALLTYPQNVFNGFVQGVFPPFTVQAGDRFQSLINCEYLVRDCYVVYRLDYQIDNGPVQNLWAFGERYEGLYYQADVDLSPLAGKSVKFILRVNANGSPTGDRAMWVAPGIVRSGGAAPTAVPPTATATSPAVPTPTATVTAVAPTATLTPTPTATNPPPATQQTLNNTRYGFGLQYPTGSTLGSVSDTYARINLPFTAGTNLVEKYLEVTVFENLPTCTSPLTTGYAPGTIVPQPVTSLTGIQFIKESGQEGAAGQTYEWVAYSTTKGTACVSLSFVLHSANPLNFPVPPPVYSKDLESAVFLDILSSFGWTTP